MSLMGQKHELPRRSIAVRFAPNKQTRQDGFDATLSADFVAKVFLHSRSKFLLAVHATFV
jgi:hypothetical protein